MGPLGGLMAQGAGQAMNALFGWIGERREHKRNIADWERQNEYNHPRAQMQRLQEAGLNPALMYGQSASPGISGSLPSVKSKETQFRFDPMQQMMQHQNIKQSKAQVDLTAEQIKIAQREQFLKDAQTLNFAAHTAKLGVETARSKFDLGLAQTLRNTSIQAAQENLNQLRFRTMQSHTDLVRSGIGLQKEAATKEAAIQKAKLEVQAAKEHLTGNKLINRLKEIEIYWEQQGLGRAPYWIKAPIQKLKDNPHLPWKFSHGAWY